MKVRDIEARRAEIDAGGDTPNLHEYDGREVQLYMDVLDAIAKGGNYPAAAQAKAALGRKPGRGERRVAPERQRCELCSKPVPTPAHRFCGGACSQRWEAGERP